VRKGEQTRGGLSVWFGTPTVGNATTRPHRETHLHVKPKVQNLLPISTSIE
jgi:hypothetical protein